jgi:hypothetical protein
MEYPECETCSDEILVTNVSCGVLLNVLLQHQYSKIIFVFCSGIRFVKNVLLLRLTVYFGKRKSKTVWI